MIIFRLLIILLALNRASNSSVKYKRNLVKSRVIGGTNVPSYNVASYTVSIHAFNIHICSGSILNDRWIITAAHCVKNNNFVIYAGTYDLRNTTSANRYHPLEVIVHCNYNNPGFANDIALVRTRQRIVFNKQIRYISLAKGPVAEGTVLYFTGWGATKYSKLPDDQKYPHIMQEIAFASVADDKCNNTWKSNGGIDIGNICAYNSVGKGACVGDSGGALVYKGRLLGVASFVMVCAVGFPDVFVSIPFYYDFIRTTISTCDSFDKRQNQAKKNLGRTRNRG